MAVLAWVSAAYLLALVIGAYVGIGSVHRHNIEAGSFIFVAVLLILIVFRRPTERVDQIEDAAQGWPVWRLGVAFFVAALVLYAPVITAGLFADDFVLLEAARQGRWTVWSELFRPTIFAVWRVFDRATPDVGVSFHAFNIVLHAVNATMTAALAGRLGLSSRARAAAGILFLCFPASVEPVAWPAGGQDVLMTSFVLGFLLVLTGSGWTTVRASAAVILLVAACLTKESGTTGIALAVLVCAAIRAQRSAWLLVGVSTAVVVILLMVRVSLLPLPAGYGALPSRYRVKELLVRPFATLVLPFRDVELAAMPWLAVVMVTVVVLGLCVSGSHWNRRSRGFQLALMSTGFVLASIAAVNTIFYIDGDLLGSRYLYLGSAGWAILVATLLGELTLRLVYIGVTCGLLMLATWAAMARAHIEIWTRVGRERTLIVNAAAKASSPECAEIVVEGLPQVHQGVPLFLNGFPEAMRQHLPGSRFRVGPAPTDPTACRLVWIGTGFRRH